MTLKNKIFIVLFTFFFAGSCIVGYVLREKSNVSVAKETLESTLKSFNSDEKYKVTEEQFAALEKNHALSHEQIQKLKQALNQ